MKYVLMRTDTDCELPYFMFPQDEGDPVESSFTHDISVAAPFHSINAILEYVAQHPRLISAHFLTIAKIETKEVATRIDR